jgi:6-phosphogluconolactonase
MTATLVNEHRFPDSAALAGVLAEQIRVDLHEAIAARGNASLVVSGGRTPLRLFERLRAQVLQWPQIWITLADERWVDVSSEASNEQLVRKHLLLEQAANAHFVGLKNPADTPEAGAEWATRALSRIPQPYDVVVLGMGDDGHTASLFPGSLALARALDPAAAPGCLAIHALTAPHARMTLNLAALLASRRIVLHFEGEAKWRVYQRARASGSMVELPVRAILQQKEVPVDVFWCP